MAKTKSNRVIIRAFPRLHIGLSDLAFATHRRYGGAGFSVAKPFAEVEVRVSGRGSIRALSPITRDTYDDLRQALSRMRGVTGLSGVNIVVRSAFPSHVGLGSKTALLLSVLEGVNLVAGLGLTQEDIQLLSGRGGTSGVGVSTFFSGGFLIDLGHPQDLTGIHVPSRGQCPGRIPPVLFRAPIPNEWAFHLILGSGLRWNGILEQQFFRQNAPTRKIEALKTVATLCHGVAPAVFDGDLPLLRLSLAEIHQSGFKSRELRAQSVSVRQLFQSLSKIPRLAVGLSSLGPLLYAVSHVDDRRAITCIRDAAYQAGAMFLCSSPSRNHGFERVQ